MLILGKPQVARCGAPLSQITTPPHSRSRHDQQLERKTGTHCAIWSSNAAIKKSVRMCSFTHFRLCVGRGCGSGEGKCHFKNCKTKNKTTSCQKRKGKKKYASGYLSLLPSPSNVWKPTLLRTSHDSVRDTTPILQHRSKLREAR